MISIIVPVYNAERFLNRCIDSIVCQSYMDLEIIAVNDGSSDNSDELLREYANSDKRIKVITQDNKGVAAARNTGLKNASGTAFLFVDADDWIEPDAIERLTDKLNGDTDIVFCRSDHAKQPNEAVREQRGEIEVWDRDRQQLEFMKHKRMTGMLWNKLIRRSLAEGICFNEKTEYGEDAEFLWQILKKSRRMVVTNEILYHHVMESNSISHLSFSDKKYSAIPMWESINDEVELDYPHLVTLAKERLTSAAVFSMYECRQCGYRNKEQLSRMRAIVRKNLREFVSSPNVSKKMKLYAIAIGGVLPVR